MAKTVVSVFFMFGNHSAKEMGTLCFYNKLLVTTWIKINQNSLFCNLSLSSGTFYVWMTQRSELSSVINKPCSINGLKKGEKEDIVAKNNGRTLQSLE